MNLSSVDSAANTDIAYAVLKAIPRAIRFLIPKRRNFAAISPPMHANGTFTFGITVALQNPLEPVIMAWIKRNLFFVIGGILAIGLLGCGRLLQLQGLETQHGGV